MALEHRISELDTYLFKDYRKYAYGPECISGTSE